MNTKIDNKKINNLKWVKITSPKQRIDIKPGMIIRVGKKMVRITE